MAGYLFFGHHTACDVQMASNILCLIFHSRDRCVLVQSLSSFGPVLHVKGLSCGFPLRFLSSRVQGKWNQLYFAVSSSLSLRNGMHRLLYLQVRMVVKFPNIGQHPITQTRKAKFITTLITISLDRSCNSQQLS